MITLKRKGIAIESFTAGLEYTTSLTITLRRRKGLGKPQHNDEQREKWQYYQRPSPAEDGSNLNPVLKKDHLERHVQNEDDFETTSLNLPEVDFYW